MLVCRLELGKNVTNQKSMVCVVVLFELLVGSCLLQLLDSNPFFETHGAAASTLPVLAALA